MSHVPIVGSTEDNKAFASCPQQVGESLEDEGSRLVAPAAEGEGVARVVIAESGNNVAVHIMTGCWIGEVGALAKEGAEDMEYSK